MPLKIDEQLVTILNGLKIGTEQETFPPYTEDNKPQSIVFVNGKTEAEEKIKQLINEARVEEHDWYKEKEVYQLNGQDLLPNTSVRVVKRRDVEDRIKELTGNSPSR